MNPAIFTKTEQTILTIRLSDTQATAIDLYLRGFNVFPLPSAYEWINRPGYKDNPNKKPPYLLDLLFYSRLHLCSPDCRHMQTIEFTELFERANIGLMMGRTSTGIFAIDCDSQYAFKKIGYELEQRALPFWAITSHRGGSYILRLLKGEVANVPETNIKDVQVWGNRHYIVIPPSIHPQGTFYEWYTPEPRYCIPPGVCIPPVSINDLEWLGVTSKKTKWQEPDLFGMPKWAASLSYRNREMLGRGVVDGQRNTRLTAAAYDLAGCKIPYEVSEPIVLTAAERCTPPYPKRDTLMVLQCAYKKKNVTPARNFYRNSEKTWQQAGEFAKSFDWRKAYGRKANSHRSVFLACIKRAEMDGRFVFRASVRELGEILNRNGRRVYEVLQSLCEDGLLVYSGKAQSKANLYRFGETVCSHDYSVMSTILSPCSISVDNSEYIKIPETDAEKDTFSKLGNNAWKVWHFLLKEPTRTGYSVAKKANLPISSTYTALKRLYAIGLVSYSMAECLYYGESVTNSTLEILALELGTNGTSERLRAQHRLEREIRVNWKMAIARNRWRFENQISDSDQGIANDIK